MKLSTISENNLVGVHPDLVRVVRRAVELCTEQKKDFRIICGTRTIATQKKNLAAGASATMKSRHIPSCNKCGKSCAVDIVPMVAGKVRWDWPLYHLLAPIMKQAAHDVGVAIEWGGDWRTLKDGPHWQLPWKDYP